MYPKPKLDIVLNVYGKNYQKRNQTSPKQEFIYHRQYSMNANKSKAKDAYMSTNNQCIFKNLAKCPLILTCTKSSKTMLNEVWHIPQYSYHSKIIN